MKKLNIFFAVALVAAFTFSSCNSNKAKMPTLKTQLDSLNYAFGVANGAGIKQYYIKGDSAQKQIKSLLAGMKEGMKGEVDEKNADLIELGTKIGSSLKGQEKSGLMGDSALKVDMNLIKQGLVNGLRKSKVQMTAEEAQSYLQRTMQGLQAKKIEAQFGANKIEGEKFLEENAKKPGVITTASGLQYEIIKKGTGKIPTDTSKVKVNYHGTLLDGTVFDSSVDRKEPVVFGVNQVIKGWTEALKLMPVGSKYKLYIPQQLAYGPAAQGKIKPFSTLVFEVELISIEK
ncbi:MAG: FKBP-type peptidyl-prolyl cis-trans isomerase [Paludibacter sp.]|jgi:FKBP-type peptidyl-prolyl cis-trans isomerase FklB|nr:FKBP-type peptidyl-prolyl cis-trans isomerase [Paludibacter sp.]